MPEISSDVEFFTWLVFDCSTATMPASSWAAQPPGSSNVCWKLGWRRINEWKMGLRHCMWLPCMAMCRLWTSYYWLKQILIPPMTMVPLLCSMQHKRVLLSWWRDSCHLLPCLETFYRKPMETRGLWKLGYLPSPLLIDGCMMLHAILLLFFETIWDDNIFQPWKPAPSTNSTIITPLMELPCAEPRTSSPLTPILQHLATSSPLVSHSYHTLSIIIILISSDII